MGQLMKYRFVLIPTIIGLITTRNTIDYYYKD